MSSELAELEPPEKKPKIIDLDFYIDTIDKCIKQIIGSEKNLHPIISDDFNQPLLLTKVFAGHIKNVKDISRTILTLNNKIPLQELSHLKRVCRKDIILCPLTYLQNTYSIQDYIERHVTELKDVFEYFKEVDVPLLPPIHTKQYNEARKIWPCNFHPNEYHEKLLSDNFFSIYEVQLHRKFMAAVFEVAKWYAIHKGVDFDVNSIFRDVNVTVVVDPKNCNRIVTITYDFRKDHPMQHSAMLAIDNVAKTQNGGVWSMKCNDSLLPGVETELIHHLKDKFSQFIFGLNPVKDKNASPGIEDAKIDLHEDESCPKIKKESGEKDGPYLCTGYYVYMLKEPCVMCAMALVHARAKRVFFCIDNSVYGALNSVAKLQTVPSLNHHFEVFTGFL